MKQLLLTTLLTITATTALALTDYNCMIQCANNGNVYQYCQRMCEF